MATTVTTATGKVTAPFAGAVQETLEDVIFETVSVKRFGAVGDGVADDSAAIQAAINTGKMVLIDVPCRINTSLIPSSSGKFWLRFEGDGELIQGANTQVINCQELADNIQAVSAITNTTFNYSGADAVNTDVDRLTVADASAYEAGMLVKVVSDDLIAGEGADKRLGEFAWVGAVDTVNEYVYLRGRLRETYTTAIRIARIPSTVNVWIENLKCSALAVGDAAEWNASLARFVGLRQPCVGVWRISNGYAAGISLLGCYGAQINGGVIENLRNEPSLTRFGYGVGEVSCERTQISGVQFLRSRHGTTTASNTVAAGSTSIHLFGSCREGLISDCTGDDNFGPAFDTHPDARNYTFANCKATATVRGPNAGSSGFQIRGRGNRVIGCSAFNTLYGVAVIQSDNDNSNDRNVIQDFYYKGWFVGLYLEGRTTSVRTPIIDVIDCVVETTGVRAVDVRWASVKIKGGVIRTIGSGTTGAIRARQHGIIYADSVSFDMDQTGGNRHVFVLEDATAIIRARNCDASRVAITAICDAGGTTGEITVNGFDYNSIVTGNIVNNAGPANSSFLNLTDKGRVP